MADNTNINLNPARQDKFFFALGDIPSTALLTASDLTSSQAIQMRIDDKNYYNLGLKGLQLPGLSIGELKIDTPFSPVSEVDMKYTYDTFSTTIKLDKDFLIYKMMILWMILIKQPDKFNQFGMLDTFDATATDGILTILNNFNEPVISFEFYELRPISIPSIPLTYESDGEEISIDITWAYTYFMPRTYSGEAYSTDL